MNNAMKHKYLLLLLAVVLPLSCFCTREDDFYSTSTTEPFAGIDDSELLIEGKTESARILLNTNMWWKASVEYSADDTGGWCELTPDSGYGKVDVDLNCTRNFQLDKERTATVVIEGNDANTKFRKEFTLVQKSSSPYIEVVSVSENGDLDVPIVKSVNVLSVLSNSDWTAECDKPWCIVTSAGKAGNAELKVECATNKDAAERDARICLKSLDGKVNYVFKVCQDDDFSPTVIEVVKTPGEFKASWKEIVGAEHYEIIAKSDDGTEVGRINVGAATSCDLAADPLFAVPQYAGYVKLSVITYSEDPEVYSVSDEVASNSHFTSGKGTASEPFVIGDIQSLYNITKTNSILHGAYYKLDFVPEMKDFVPVCSAADPFDGIFDGNGKTISGWKTTLYASENNCVGFFGAVNAGAAVSGLDFSDCVLTIDKGDGDVPSGNNGFGFVTGYNKGTIENINIKSCTVQAIEGASPLFVGAVAGRNEGKISKCMTSGGRLSAAEDRNKSDEFNCGGIAGINTSSGEINDCVNGNEIIAMNIVGGIAGYNDGKIISCGNTGKITANYYFGGIAGYVKTTGNSTVLIKNCYNKGTIVMDEPAGFGRGAAYLGGITSRVHSKGKAIVNCFNSGKIVVGSSVSGSNMRIGGIVGHVNNTGSVENCYFCGEVTIAGKVNYGGIVGEFADKATKIVNCYSAGKVIAAESASGNMFDAFGKCAKSVTITSCYALSGGGNGFAGGTTTNVGAECRIVSEAELKSQEVLTGWDFSSVWKYGNGYSFPQLIANPHK